MQTHPALENHNSNNNMPRLHHRIRKEASTRREDKSEKQIY